MGVASLRAEAIPHYGNMIASSLPCIWPLLLLHCYVSESIMFAIGVLAGCSCVKAAHKELPLSEVPYM